MFGTCYSVQSLLSFLFSETSFELIPSAKDSGRVCIIGIVVVIERVRACPWMSRPVSLPGNPGGATLRPKQGS